MCLTSLFHNLYLCLMHSSPRLPDIQGRHVNNRTAETNPALSRNYRGSTLPGGAGRHLSALPRAGGAPPSPPTSPQSAPPLRVLQIPNNPERPPKGLLSRPVPRARAHCSPDKRGPGHHLLVSVVVSACSLGDAAGPSGPEPVASAGIRCSVKARRVTGRRLLRSLAASVDVFFSGSISCILKAGGRCLLHETVRGVGTRPPRRLSNCFGCRGFTVGNDLANEYQINMLAEHLKTFLVIC